MSERVWKLRRPDPNHPASHGHYKGQYVDGMRTPNIIHNAAGEVHKYDDDYTVILADWCVDAARACGRAELICLRRYHDEHDFLLTTQFLNDRNPTGVSSPRAVLAKRIADLSTSRPSPCRVRDESPEPPVANNSC